MENVSKLIKNMTSAEKSMFTKLEAKNKSKSFYKLYKIINSTTDSKKLKIKIKNISIQNLNYESHNLYSRLLRAISIKSLFYEGETEKLTSELIFCTELKSKGLYKQALKKLKKLKAKALSLEKFSILVIISNLEEKISYDSFDSLYFSHIELLLQERFYYSQQLDLISKLKYLKYKFIELQYELPMYVPRHTLEKIFTSNLDLLNIPEKDLSVKAKDYLFFCNGLKSLFERDGNKSLEYCHKRIALIEMNKNILGSEFSKALNNIIFTAIIFKDESIYQSMMKKLENYEVKDKDYIVKKFCELYLKLKWYSVNSDFSKLDELKESYKKFMTTHRKQLNQTQIDSINLSFANILISSNEIQLAGEILSDWRLSDIEKYSLPYYYLCSIYVHFTLENNSLVDSFQDALYRNKNIPDGLMALAKIMKKIQKNPSKLDEHIEESTKMKNDNETYYHFIEIDFLTWVQNLKNQIKR